MAGHFPKVAASQSVHGARRAHTGHWEQVVDVKKTIRRALVELHFELRHFCIRKKSQDSFNGGIERVIVLQPGESHPAIPYELSYKHSARARNPYACSETERRWCRTFNPNLYSMGS